MTPTLQRYDVALWRTWPPHLSTHLVAYVEADSPLLAVLSLMETHHLTHVARAAARLDDLSPTDGSPIRGPVTRWHHLSITHDYDTPTPEQEDPDHAR